jgi:hypothetical protein
MSPRSGTGLRAIRSRRRVSSGTAVAGWGVEPGSAAVSVRPAERGGSVGHVVSVKHQHCDPALSQWGFASRRARPRSSETRSPAPATPESPASRPPASAPSASCEPTPSPNLHRGSSGCAVPGPIARRRGQCCRRGSRRCGSRLGDQAAPRDCRRWRPVRRAGRPRSSPRPRSRPPASESCAATASPAATHPSTTRWWLPATPDRSRCWSWRAGG